LHFHLFLLLSHNTTTIKPKSTSVTDVAVQAVPLKEHEGAGTTEIEVA
jgi:hypothetical protein